MNIDPESGRVLRDMPLPGDTSWFGSGTFLWVRRCIPARVLSYPLPHQRPMWNLIEDLERACRRVGGADHKESSRLINELHNWRREIQVVHPTLYVSEQELGLYHVRRALDCALLSYTLEDYVKTLNMVRVPQMFNIKELEEIGDAVIECNYPKGAVPYYEPKTAVWDGFGHGGKNRSTYNKEVFGA